MSATVPVGSKSGGRTGPSVRRAGVFDKAFAVAVFAMFVVVWVGFAIVLLGDRSFVDQAWESLRAMPAPIQLVVWVLFLPIAVGMWIIESDWSTFVGLLLGLGMVVWTIVAVAGLVRAFRAS